MQEHQNPHPEIARLVAELPAHMGTEWTAQVSPHHGAGMFLTFRGVPIIFGRIESYGSNAGRMEWVATGGPNSLPRPKRTDPPKAIRTGKGRPADAVARDIARRLAAHAVEYYAAARAEMEKDGDDASRTHDLAAELAGILGVEAPEMPDTYGAHKNTDARLSWYRVEDDAGHYGNATVSTYHDLSVTFEIRHATPQQAREIVKILNAR